MTEVGTVIEHKGRNKVLVEVDRTSACDGCHAKGACMMSLQKNKMNFEAVDPIGVEVGQRVHLNIEDGAFVRACAMVYGIPLVLLLLGAISAHLFARVIFGGATLSDEISAAGAFLGLGAGIGVVRWVNQRISNPSNRNYHRYKVRVSSVLASHWGCEENGNMEPLERLV